MSDDRDDALLRNIWKEQQMQSQTPEIETLRRCERRIETQATWRNRIEYIAGGFVVAFLLAAGVSTLAGAETLGSMMTGIGHLAVAAGTLMVVFRLQRLQRAARATTPGTPILTHLRSRLAAERNMLRSAWRWYVAPLVPGFVLIYGGAALAPDPNWFIFWTGTLLTSVVIGGIVWLNHRAARRLDAELIRLDDRAQS